MKTILTMSLFGLACTALLSVGKAHAPDGPLFEKLVIPAYPYLARLTGTHGTVRVNLTLDPHCNTTDISIGKGSPRLVEAVTRAAFGSGTPVTFRPCTSAVARVVHLAFIFSLRGQPTNEWSATSVRVSSTSELSFDIEITTTPADLEGLGLENRGADEPEDVQEAAGQDKEKILLTDLIIPSYPPLARTGRVQGEVKVALEFDSKCRVSASQIVAGHPLLNSAVLKAVQDWHLPSCTAGERNVNATFRFVLAEPDEPSYDDWAPTHIEIAGPYEFEIRTTAPYPFVYD